MNYEYIHNQNQRLSHNNRSGAEAYGYFPFEEHLPYFPDGGITSNTYPAYDYSSVNYAEQPTKTYAEGAQYPQFCCNNQPAFSSKALKRKYNIGPGADDKVNNADAVFQGRDSSYPEALNKLIHALQCELCNVKLNSLISARDHYESKLHDRNITAWLRKNYTEKGLEAPVVKRFVRHGSSVGPDAYYCKPCDVKLTSITHANQHNAGRKHRLAIARLNSQDSIPKASVEAGCYQAGSTLSTQNAQTPSTYTGFYAAKPEDYQFTNITNEKQIQIGTINPNHMLYCATCHVNVTSAVQMTMHLAGIKHKKKLLKSDNEVGVKKEPTESPAVVDTPEVTNYNLMSIPTVPVTYSSSKNNSDTTMYRTPSGQYYCKVCNTTMTNVMSLHQHLLGKRHQKAQAEETAKASINNAKFMK